MNTNLDKFHVVESATFRANASERLERNAFGLDNEQHEIGRCDCVLQGRIVAQSHHRAHQGAVHGRGNGLHSTADLQDQALHLGDAAGYC